MSMGMAMAAMGGGGGGGGGMSTSATSGLGDDMSAKTFHGVTFNKAPSASQSTNDTVKLAILVVGAVLVAKMFKG